MGKIIIIGLGQMGAGFGKPGGYYTSHIINAGVPPEDIVGIDIDSVKIAAFEKKFPGVGTILVQPDQPLNKFVQFGDIGSAFLCTNTPSHHRLLVELMQNGVLKIFCEKPLALDMRGINAVRREKMRTGAEIFTAYLMNFSSALMYLIERGEREDLKLIEGVASWGKNRMYDTRPTPGDLEDESVHPIGVFHTLLAGYGQTIEKIRVGARLSFLDYIDPEVQRKAHEADAGFPLVVNSSAFINEEIRVVGIPFPILLQTNSSFVKGKQVRMVECRLAQRDNPSVPVYAVEFNFDTPAGDTLEVTRLKGNVREELQVFGGDKVGAETRAFLDFVASGKRDPRLTGYFAARMSVALTTAIVDSNKLGGSIVDAYGDADIELSRAINEN